MVLKELLLNSFYLKELILNSFYFGEGVVVLKELILNSFYFGRVWWSWKNSFWTVSTWKNWFWKVSNLGGCGGLERTQFEQFLLWEGVTVLKELILNSFYFGKVWWSWKICILNSFYFGSVWWSWKNSFWTVSTLGVFGGLERSAFWTVFTLGGCGGLERTHDKQFLLWEGVVVLKELLLNSFYFGRVWWSWKNSF